MSGVLVHEWIARSGGSENVLEAFGQIFPREPIVCLWNDAPQRFLPDRVRQTWLARTPLRRHKALSLPVMPVVWRHQRERYDWALISSHAFAHHARFPGVAAADRYVYVHSPARYIWTPELDRRGASSAARAAAALLRPIDRRRAKESVHFAANSEFVRARIRQAWGLEATVIHPPVDVAAIQLISDWSSRLTQEELQILDELPGGFLLGASRFIPYKQLELVLRAGEAAGRPVVLAGSGSEEARLRALADRSTVPVRFVIAPSTPLLYALYQRCAAFIFPAVEDFGIMPVEAMAAGAAVVARSEGGTAESTIDGMTGALSDFTDDHDLAQAVDRAIRTDPAARRDHADMFSRARFERRIHDWVSR